MELLPISTISKVIELVVDEFGKIFKRSRIVLRIPFFEWHIKTTSQTIDERIEKLDDAKEALSQGLEAIDELRSDASRHKSEVQNALEELSNLNAETEELGAKREAISKVLESEVSAFRDVVGIPSPKQRQRDKVLGFVSGVIASMVASALIYCGVLVFKSITAKPDKEKNQVEQVAAPDS